MKKNILKRSFNFHNRKESDSIEGYAFKFNEVADGWFGKEKFSPDLKVEIDQDCFLFRDHNPERLLGKVGKNMSIKTDNVGLFFRVDPLPNTELAKETKELVSKGLLTGASVGFSVMTERLEDSVNIYEKIKLYEISIVSRPYYKSSEVESRKQPEPKKEKELKPPELY